MDWIPGARLRLSSATRARLLGPGTSVTICGPFSDDLTFSAALPGRRVDRLGIIGEVVAAPARPRRACYHRVRDVASPEAPPKTEHPRHRAVRGDGQRPSGCMLRHCRLPLR